MTSNPGICQKHPVPGQDTSRPVPYNKNSRIFRVVDSWFLCVHNQRGKTLSARVLRFALGKLAMPIPVRYCLIFRIPMEIAFYTT